VIRSIPKAALLAMPRHCDEAVHGDKELIEKLGRNDLCPCGSNRRFQGLLHEVRRIRR